LAPILFHYSSRALSTGQGIFASHFNGCTTGLRPLL
jgi:hypothetical protein